MTTIDYDALRGASGGEPLDGIHTAYLMRAELVETAKGPALVSEWQTMREPRYYWTTWFGFEGTRLKFTQEFLDSLGVDRAHITDDELFENALRGVVGTEYQVRTEAGGSWVNTYVIDKAEVQRSMDAPIDTSGLPQQTEMVGREPVAAGIGVPDDDDIPF
jgi:hypothetical protein